MMNSSRGVGDGKYPTLGQLETNADSAIREGDLLFIASTGESYEATTDVSASVILNTSPQLYAHLRGGSGGSAASFPEPNWDFEVVFNDGVELRSGYGTRDAHGNKAVDFSRASGTGNINKSGVSETLAVDEIAIGSDGVACFEGYINILPTSNLFAGYSAPLPTITANTADTADPAGSNNAVKCEIPTGATFGIVGLSIAESSIIGDKYSGSVFVKKGNSPLVTLEVYGSNVEYRTTLNFDTETVSNPDSTLDKLNDKWYRLTLNITLTVISSAMVFRTWIGGRDTSNEGDYVYMYGQQVTKTDGVRPYKETTGVPASRSPDIISVPMMGNMPAAGKPFTIEVDIDAPLTTSNLASKVFTTSDYKIDSYFQSPNTLYFRVDNGSGYEFVGAVMDSLAEKRLTYVYSGSEIQLYSGGVLLGSVAATGTPTYSVLSSLFLGSSGSSEFINGSIKDVRIFHKALTSEQIKARGGYNGE